MRIAHLLLPAASLLLLAACATTRLDDTQRLALYQGQAGEPVKSISYNDPMGWERVDDSHLLLKMRPREAWLLSLSEPCLDWGRGSQAISITHQAGFVSAGFDRVEVPNAPLSCRISEIRPVDPVALRDALNARAAAARSGS